MASEIFQGCLDEMKSIARALSWYVNGSKKDRQPLSVRKDEENPRMIVFTRLIFDVDCHYLQAVRNSAEGAEKQRNQYECLLDICGEHMGRLTETIDAKEFLENLQPYGGDYEQAIYEVQYPFVIADVGETDYPYDIRELYIREWKKFYQIPGFGNCRTTGYRNIH